MSSLWLFLIWGFSVYAQETRTYPISIGNSYNLSLGLQTRGASFQGRYVFGGKPLQWCAGLEISSLRGNKELRIRSLFMDVQDGSRFVFDKINRFTVVTPSFGVSKVLFPKTHYNKVAVIGYVQTGLALGFLRPYYLHIATPDPSRPGVNIITEAEANPDKYVYSVVVGEVLPWRFLSSKAVIPGFSLQLSSAFSMNRYNSIIRGVELTCRMLIFPKKIPIMYMSPNQSSYVTFGISFINGKKWLNNPEPRASKEEEDNE